MVLNRVTRENYKSSKCLEENVSHINIVLNIDWTYRNSYSLAWNVYEYTMWLLYETRETWKFNLIYIQTDKEVKLSVQVLSYILLPNFIYTFGGSLGAKLKLITEKENYVIDGWDILCMGQKRYVTNKFQTNMAL